MQEGADQALLVDPRPGGERGHVDAIERPVLAFPHQPLDRLDRAGVRRLPQRREETLRFAHAAQSTPKRRPAKAGTAMGAANTEAKVTTMSCDRRRFAGSTAVWSGASPWDVF